MLELALSGILPPLLLAGVLIGYDPRRLTGLGLALGVFGALFALTAYTIPPFPAVSGDEWLCWALIACGLVALTDDAPLATHSVVMLGALLLLGSSRALLDNLWPRWETGEAVLHTVVVAGLAGLHWANIGALSRRQPGAFLPGELAACAGAGALVLALGGSAKLGQLLGALAVGLAVFAGWALRDRQLRLGRGAGLVAAFGFVGLLAAGHYFAEPSRAALALVGGAPFLLWLGHAPPLKERGPWLRRGLPLLLLLPVLGLAAWLAAGAAPDYGY